MKSSPLSLGLKDAIRMGGRYRVWIWLVLFWLLFWLLFLVAVPIKQLSLDRPEKTRQVLWQLEGYSIRQRGRFMLGRDGVLEEYGFTKEALEALPKEHVQRMKESYNRASSDGASRVVLIHVQHGMSNRLRAYLSAKAFAVASGRHLRVVWVPDQHCETRFTDLFETSEDVTEYFEPEEVAGPNFVTYDYMDPDRKYEFIKDGPENIYVSSAYLLNSTHGFEDVDLSGVFQALWPVKAVRNVLKEFRNAECPEFLPTWWPCIPYVSVHMRQGVPPIGEANAEDLDQYSQAVRSTLYMARTQMSATVHFIQGLKDILATKPALKVFVASDTPESVRELEHAFGNRVFHLKHPDHCNAKRRDVACQRAALTDLFMLAHSSHPSIMGSYWSSFTEVAALLKNKRILRASVDFEAPGLAPLVCNPNREQQARVLQGVSICTALTPARAKLLTQAMPTWLAAAGVLEVIVLDYKPGNDTRLHEAVSTFKDPRVKYVKIEGTGRFDITRASNMAVRHSRGSRIAKLDSDNKIQPGFFTVHPKTDGVYYAGNWKAARSENERHLNGVYLLERELWERVNGFDERIVGYGHDDDNLHMRLTKLARRKDLDFNYIAHIEHGDSLREGIQYTDVSIVYNAALTERLPLWDSQYPVADYECEQQLDGSCDCKIASPSETIESGLSAEERQEYKVKAFRQVVGYSADLPKEDLAKVSSLSWFEKQLQIHYQKGRRQWVVVRPIGSCADRTDAIASGKLLAETMGRPFRVIWLPEAACMERISALFGAELDVAEEFFEWEVNYKFKAFDLTIGPDWILPFTPLNPKKSLFILAGGAFGNSTFSPATLKTARQALLPIASPSGQHTDPPLLIVDLMGSLPERMMQLARSTVVSHKVQSRLVIVWDPVEVGGLHLHDILQAPYMVIAPGDIPTGLPTTKLSVKDVTVEEVGKLDRERGFHARVRDGRKLDSVEVDEVHWNIVIGLLDITFEVKEAAKRQMVGKSFRGLVINGDSSCSDEGLMGAIQASLIDVTPGGSYFAAAAPPAVCARLKERGVLCADTCHAKSSRDCHLSHLAMTMALAQSKGLFFTSWGDKSVDWILRRGLIPGTKLECDSHTLDTSIPVFRPALHLSSGEKRELTETSTQCDEGKLHIVIQYPVLKSAKSGVRQAEFAEAFTRNLNHPQIAGVHVMLEAKSDEGVIRGAFPDPCKKLHFAFLGRRLTYNDSFAYANEHLPGKLCATANGDISFAAGLDTLSLDRHLAGGKRALALSRHEETESDVCGRNMCYRYENSETGFLSADAFLFLSPVPESVVEVTGFGPQPGSENVVIWALKRAGFDVRNPCRTVQVFHHHCSGDRSSLPTDVKSWETFVEEDARVDMKVCGEQHCGNGFSEKGAEVLEDLEETL